MHNQDLDKLAQQNIVKQEFSKQIGTIYDQNGHVLAQDANSYKLVAELKGANQVENKEDTAKKIAGVLGKDEEKILATLNKKIKVKLNLER